MNYVNLFYELFCYIPSAVRFIPVKSHGFAVSLTIFAMKSRSHADYVISHAFQIKQILRKLFLWFNE